MREQTVQEQLDLISGDNMVSAIRMNIQEYSDWRDWPVPFGMEPQKKGYKVGFSDGTTTWFSKNHFKKVFTKNERKGVIA